MEKEIITEQENLENYILLKKLGASERTRAYKFINMGVVSKVKTSMGIAVDKTQLEKAIYETTIGKKVEKGGFKIDLSVPSRLNCLYKRLADMNKSNKQFCQMDNRLPRYVDEKGYTCINLKDYLKPQIDLIAKKLECKPIDVYNHIFELIQKTNKHNYEGNNDV